MDERTMSISDLKSENTKEETVKIVEVSEGDIKPYEKEPTPQDIVEDKINKKMTKSIDKEKDVKQKEQEETMKNEMEKLDEMGIDPSQPIEEMQDDIVTVNKEDSLDGDFLEEDEDFIEKEYTQYKKESKPVEKINLVDTEEDKIIKEKYEEKKVVEHKELPEEDDADLDTLLDDDDDEDKDENDKDLDIMKTKIKDKIKPFAKSIDLSTLTISKKPVSLSNALPKSKKNIVDSPLPFAGKIISMEEFTGIDIQNLAFSNNRSKYNEYQRIYDIIYSHDKSPNKPVTLENWLKVMRFEDIDHLFFAIYKSAFNTANYVPYQCPECGEIFISENIDINDMVKYNSEKTKKYVLDILEKSNYIGNEYEAELMQISDEYAIALKNPSIFNVIFENSLLSDKILEKYHNLLELISYIDSIFMIDIENNELRPIEFKVYEDKTKTYKEKIKTCNKVLKTLTSDQYSQLNGIKDRIVNRSENFMTYLIPKAVCPKCKHVIPEQPMTAEQMLFTRHQLTRLANM